jgi:predicted DNA-binding transcriptional regulator AlpA
MTSIDGRPARTRAELMAEYGLGRSTLEKWFRERARNGHPEPAGTVGSQLAWDAAEWDTWYAARRTAPKAPPGLATRDELAAEHGVSRHTMKRLWAERAGNGHPDAAHQAGKALYWDRAEWAAWYAAYQERQQRERERDAAGEGDPDELITLADAARLLGLAQTSVTVYPSRPPAGWPEPARAEPLGGGRVRRLYRRGDILGYARLRG